MEARIGNKSIKMYAIVTEGYPDYTIVGANTIMKHKEILTKQLTIESPGSKIHCINAVGSLELKQEETVKKCLGMFTTEVTLGRMCNISRHKIYTEEFRSIYQRNGRIPVHYEEIEKNPCLGIIRESQSHWCSRIVPVPRPDGSVRMCIDYRPFDAIAIRDRYPLPMIQEILDKMSTGKIFSRLDATLGYYQIAMEEKDVEKTAFAYKNGLYEFVRMPFGLCNAPVTFQRAMNIIFRKEIGKFFIPYLDDIIVFFSSINEHENYLEIVMGKLKAANISLNKKKCNFFKWETKILRFVISEGKAKSNPERVQTIKEFQKPITIRDLRSFLCMTGFCREFVPHYVALVRVLEKFLRGETKNSIKKIA